MKGYGILSRRWIAVFIALIMVFSLVGCGGKAASNDPEGTFTCTQKNEGNGWEAIEEPLDGYGDMIFNADGTGIWEYALTTDIEWKVKGDKLTIIEEYEGQKETFKGTWDGEKVSVNVWGYDFIFEK